MKIFKFLIAILIVAWAGTAISQDELDALRYSQNFFGGSARSMGMAGSFGALGADPAAISTNPAGLARFAKGHFSITMGGNLNNSRSVYNDVETKQSANAATLQNLAVVFSSPKNNNPNGWKSVQTTFSYNRIADFTGHMRHEGEFFYSLLDVFANQGFGISTFDIYDFRPFTTALAYDTYALDDFGTVYQPRLPGAGNLLHQHSVKSRGGIAEYSFGLSGNMNDNFYIGASVNLQNIRYFENMSHSETVLDIDPNLSLRSFNYDFNYQAIGRGANAKIGFLWLPSDEFRIGLAYHTPTVLNFREDFDADMSATHDFGVNTASLKPSDFWRYRFRNPGRWLASVGYVFDQRLAFNADVEMVNLSRGEYRSSNTAGFQDSYLLENFMVDSLYRRVFNIRLGAEMAVTPEWFLRAGYANYGRPFSNDHKNEARSTHFFSGGLGYRKGNFVFDVAVLRRSAKSEYYAFDLSGILLPTDPDIAKNMTLIKQRNLSLVATLGLRF